MDNVERCAEREFQKKNHRRKQLASLPYPQKVRAIVRMQRMTVPLVGSRNPRARIWKISEDSGE
jgi:hypothetical protein